MPAINVYTRLRLAGVAAGWSGGGWRVGRVGGGGLMGAWAGGGSLVGWGGGGSGFFFFSGNAR